MSKRIKLQQKQDTISTVQGFNNFLQNCKIKNLSQATIKGYKHHFVKFFKFYGEDSDISFVSQKTVNEFILYLQDNLKNTETINTTLRHFRAVVNYWVEQKYCKPVKITMLKAQQKMKECYTDEELKVLLKKPNIKQCSFAEYRNWVIINTLIATGLTDIGNYITSRYIFFL